MFKRILCLVVAVATTICLAVSVCAVDYGEEYQNQPTKTYTQVFHDVNKKHWAFSYIGEMNQRGVISGYPNGYYYPENFVTRAEFAKIMCIASGLDIEYVYSTSYVDVSADEWYAPYIEAGKYYLSGYLTNGNSYYRPEDNALREDIAVALVKLKGYSTVGADESILKAMFKDYQSISVDARKYVATALENGLISGYEDNTFRGQDSITRAEAATLLWRAYQYGNGNKTFDIESLPKNESNDTFEKEQTVTNEEKHKLTIEIDKIDIAANVGDVVEFTATIKYNYMAESGYDIAQGSVMPKVSGDTDILPSLLGTYRDWSDGWTKVKYVTKALNQGSYELDFTVENVSKRVTITVNAPKASYSCDTIAKASLSDALLLSTIDDENNIYYYDNNDNAIYKLNIKGKKKTKIIDVEKIEYDKVEVVEKEITKEVPKTITKKVEKEIPVLDDMEEDVDSDEAVDIDEDDDLETNSKPQSKIVTEEVSEIVYETITQIVEEEAVVGTYKDFKVEQIYYNDGNDTLLLAGEFRRYSSETSLYDENVYKQVMYKINGKKMEFYTEDIGIKDGIMGNFDDGRLIIAYSSYDGCSGVANYYIVDCNDFSSTRINSMSSFEPRSMVITSGSNMYSTLLSRTHPYQYRYSFNQNKWEIVTDADADYVGEKDGNFYYWDVLNGKIAKSDVNGKIKFIEGIDTLNDVEVKDFADMPIKHYYVSDKFYVLENDSFVFYDPDIKAFRILEKI